MSIRDKLECLCLGRLFQPSLMFASKAGAYTSKTPFRYTTLGWGPGLINKRRIRLERPARDKYSNLLRTIINYDCKRFYNIDA